MIDRRRYMGVYVYMYKCVNGCEYKSECVDTGHVQMYESMSV